jgi:5-methylthioadenosine/S-adenosylhomocysteine deaminase
VLVLRRHHHDPYESVIAADPIDVELVTIGGDLAYGRAEWIESLTPGMPRLEPVIAWGKRMLLDTGYQAQPDTTESPSLAQLRAELTHTYPPVGPIWA